MNSSPDAKREPTHSLANAFPILSWLPRYRAADLRPDLIAAVTVWLVLAPEALAYAGIAGVAPAAGLYAALPALLLYAVFATSKRLVMGPSSVTAIMSAAAVGAVAAHEPVRYAELTALLALMVGVLAIAAGLLRMGWVSYFIAEPVLAGFIAGLVLIVIAGQIPKLLGFQIEPGNFFQECARIVNGLDRINTAAAIVGVGGLALMLVLRRFARAVPAALIVVALGIAAVNVFDLASHGVEIVGQLPSALPAVGVPHFTSTDLEHLFAAAAGILLVAYAEGLGAARAFGARHGTPIDPSKELLGLGAANVGAGLCRGFVVNGSLSKTSVADAAGARTQMFGLATAGLILLTILLLTPLFHDLPEPALAAIVIAAVAPAFGWKVMRRFLRVRPEEFLLASVCLLGVLIFETLPGLLIAVILSILIVIYRASHPLIPVLGRRPEQDDYRDLDAHPEAQTTPGVLILRFDAPLFFANAYRLGDRLRSLIADADAAPRVVILDAEPINFVDLTGADALAELAIRMRARGVELLVAAAKTEVVDLLNRASAGRRIGGSRFFPTLEAAVEAAVAKLADERPGAAAGTEGQRR